MDNLEIVQTFRFQPQDQDVTTLAYFSRDKSVMIGESELEQGGSQGGSPASRPSASASAEDLFEAQPSQVLPQKC